MERAGWLLKFGNSERNRVKATAILEDVVTHFPMFVEARIVLARGLLELGYVEPAMNELAIADQLQPRSSLVALELAWLYQQKDDLQRAQSYVTRAVQSAENRGVDAVATVRRLAEPDHADAAPWTPSHDVRAHIARYAHRLIAGGRADQAAELLEPLLAESRGWRAAWMGLAAMAVRDPDVAAEWLARVEQHLPQDVPHERVALAQHWASLALRSNRSELRKTAREKIEQVLELPEATAEIWFIRGALAEQDHDWELATASYRAALERDADLHAAKNNLAMMLAMKGDDLQEALDLAHAAVKSLPTRADYLDTLSNVQAKLKDYDQAIANLRSAVQLQPDQPKWKARLAKLLAEAGRDDEAARVLKELETSGTGDG
jgi:Tfp pilus assembly protein PilF